MDLYFYFEMNKKIVSVDFVDFWPNFYKKDNYFYHLLETKFDVKITDSNPDLLFYSNDYMHENNRFKKQYENSRKIFFSGESSAPDLDFADLSLTCHKSTDKNFRLPLWVLFINWFDVGYKKDRDQSFLLDQQKLLKVNKKINKKFCSFVASNNSGKRMEVIPKLLKEIDIDCGGQLFNNTNKTIKGRGDQKWKINFLQKYKFNFCFENDLIDGYVTEKIIHSMFANSIPVYWGSDVVFDDFNKNSFIYLNEYNIDELIIKLNELNKNKNEYLELLAQPWFKNNQFPSSILPRKVLEQIIG